MRLICTLLCVSVLIGCLNAQAFNRSSTNVTQLERVFATPFIAPAGHVGVVDQILKLQAWSKATTVSWMATEGTLNSVGERSPSVVYANPGTYDVSVNGEMPQRPFRVFPDLAADSSTVVDVSAFSAETLELGGYAAGSVVRTEGTFTGTRLAITGTRGDSAYGQRTYVYGDPADPILINAQDTDYARVCYQSISNNNNNVTAPSYSGNTVNGLAQ